MPWQLVDPKYYAPGLAGGAGGGVAGGAAVQSPKAAARGFGLQGESGAGEVLHESALWYQDTSAREQGELVLHLDGTGDVAWFQLSHTRWPHGKEHVVEWSAGGGLHAGEVDGADGNTRYRSPSPTVKRFAEMPEALLVELTDYFLKHAGTLDERHREQVAAAIWTAINEK